MPSNKTFRTYSRGRNTSISSAQAIDILFADNLTKRKLHAAGKKKNKVELKELQTKIKSSIKSIIQDEPSFHVHVNDTFDNVFRLQGKHDNLKSINVSNTASTSRMQCHSSNYVSVASPMVKKLRSFSKQDLGQSSNVLRSWYEKPTPPGEAGQSSNVLGSWFEKPTPPGEGITNSLEIEVSAGNWNKNHCQSISLMGRASPKMLRSSSSRNRNISLPAPPREGNTSKALATVDDKALLKALNRKSLRASPIMLRSGSKSKNKNISPDISVTESATNKQIDNSLINPVFTNSIRERIFIHSSTPVVTTKTKCAFRQPISPIKNSQDQLKKCIFESLEEIKGWNTSLATSTQPSTSKSGIDTLESSVPSKRLPTLTVNLEAFEGFLATSMNHLMQKQANMRANMTACNFEEKPKNRTRQTTNISLTEFENFYSMSYQKNVLTGNSSFFYRSQETNNFITHRKRKTPVLSPQKNNNKGKELVVVLNNNLNKNSKPNRSSCQEPAMDKQLLVKLPRLSLLTRQSKSRLSNGDLTSNKSLLKSSVMNRRHTQMSVYVDESKTARSFEQSTSQVLINAKESSVLHMKTRGLGFEDVSEKENKPSSARSSGQGSGIPKRKSLLDNSSTPKKRYLKSSITENSYGAPSTSTAGRHNISEDLFTSGDFTNNNKSAYQLSLLLTSKTEIASKNSTKTTENDCSISRFSYDDPRQYDGKTDYCQGLCESSLEFLKSNTSFLPENDIIIIDDSQQQNETLSTFDKSNFKIPLAPSNSHQLKTGKSWRRSTQTSFVKKSPLDHQRIKIEPLEESKVRLSRRLTALQKYISPCASSRPSLSAKDIVFKYCEQTEPQLFEKLYPKMLLQDAKKIGEGVYGEVFLCTKKKREMTVMKIIPIEGDKLINGEKQKMFHEILSEVVIVSQLSNLRNTSSNKTSAFCEVQKISCVVGKYPKTLLELWHDYDKAKGSENDPPDKFDNNQLYIVLELGNAGQDLEAFVFQNAAQSLAMFKQIAYALAVAEEQLQFEHRDLHWGNVLLRPVNKDKKTTFKLKGKLKSLASEGVEATIIDFTLSRVVHDGVVIFNDLSHDPDLFVASGDYQFDVYRLMKERNNNDWKTFTPYSNILWLHYILKKSMTALRYKNPRTKIHAKNLALIKKYEAIILNFNSVSEFVTANL